MAQAPAPLDEETAAILEDAFIDYRDAGLRMPPIPRELLDELDEFGDWRWGTDDLDLTDADGFLQAARQPGGEPSLAFGQAGHGVNSWFSCYRLLLDRLAVYVRLPFGGAYMDNQAAAETVEAAHRQLELLIPAAEAAAERLGPGHRLVVAFDAIGDSGWEIAGAEPWQPADDPLGAALDRLSQPLPEDEEP